MESPFKYRINFLGCPSKPDVPWSRENLRTLQDLGFNGVQLNIAWGARPGDEPLNLEDVVDVQGTALAGVQTLSLRSLPGDDAAAKRREKLKDRIVLCRELGLRTIFHFGAPYNMHAQFGDDPPNCLMEERVIGLYEGLIKTFSEQFPGVEDLLLYTYDQDAWLCSEFGSCPRCMGIALHERVPHFVNRLACVWKQINPDGRLWWEPWELSAGQVLRSIGGLDSQSVGLMLHANIAEVIVTTPVDRWLKNAVTLSRSADIPVVVEYFLGAPTEEVEPFQHLSWPVVTWRGLRSIADLHVDGIKEYYGSIPTREDANLRMASAFFDDPGLTEEEALRQIAAPYGKHADEIILFWRKTSEAMELFPWEASWFIREIGKCDPAHSMSAAFLRGQQAHTPSWESTRRAIFMKTDNSQPDPWMLEDVQLRCDLAARRMTEAIEIGPGLAKNLEGSLSRSMDSQLTDIASLRQRTLSYVYHIRETNLTRLLRRELDDGKPVPQHIVGELRGVLESDIDNGSTDSSPALELLDANPHEYTRRYFKDGDADRHSKGFFSVTSR